MLLCMAVVGGAIVPLLTGILADRATLPWELILPASCYVLIGVFARLTNDKDRACRTE